MPAVIGVLLGMLLGLASGGRLVRIQSLRLVGQGPLLMLYVLQSVARGRFPRAAEISAIAFWVWVLAVLGILVILCCNWRHPGVAVIAFGLAANLAVVLANGAMPVSVPRALWHSGIAERVGGSVMYVDSNVGTLVPWLGDVVPSGLGGGSLLLSVGDIMLVVGVCSLLVSCIVNAKGSE